MLLVDLLLGGVIVLRLISPGPSVPRLEAVSEKTPAGERVEDLAAPSFAPAARLMGQRELFGFPGQTGVGTAPVENKESAQAPAGNPLENFRLAGIILDARPQAVVMGPGPEGETSFLSVGDRLNGAVLKDVEERLAIFDFQGQRLELSIQ